TARIPTPTPARTPTPSTGHTPMSTTPQTPAPTTPPTPTPTTPQTPTPTIARTPVPTTPQNQAPTIARTPTPTIGTIAALARITNQRDQGALSNEEFAAAKDRILSAATAARESSEERSNVGAGEATVAGGGDLADVSRTVS